MFPFCLFASIVLSFSDFLRFAGFDKGTYMHVGRVKACGGGLVPWLKGDKGLGELKRERETCMII